MNRVRNYVGYDKEQDVRWYEPVSICILDSGIVKHSDFEDRIIGFQDFVNQRVSLYDDYGHGTHIAGICAGSGKQSAGKYQGIAPWSSLVVGKVLGKNGEGKIEHLMNGITWCIDNQQKYNIRLLNISVGLIQQVEIKKQKSLMDIVEHAWDKGIVTVCAAGNNGPKAGSVTIPGTSAKVITVGSVDVYGNRYIPSKYSGRGPTTECVSKPEIYAPGNEIISCSNIGGYTRKTGTSMAVPVVTGGIALLLQKYPKLSPVDVKLRLYEKYKQIDNEKMFYLPDLLSDKDIF